MTRGDNVVDNSCEKCDALFLYHPLYINQVKMQGLKILMAVCSNVRLFEPLKGNERFSCSGLKSFIELIKIDSGTDNVLIFYS